MKETYLIWVHLHNLEDPPHLHETSLSYPSNEELRKIAKDTYAKYIHIEKLFEFDFDT